MEIRYYDFKKNLVRFVATGSEDEYESSVAYLVKNNWKQGADGVWRKES